MKKCPYCAEEIQDEAIKCRYCGERLDLKTTTTKYASLPAGPSPQQTTVSTPPIEEKDDRAENLYEAILGEKNRIYYLTKFKEFDRQAPRLKASWNWAAFWGGGFWALYRKMYGWFFAFWGIAFLATIFEKGGLPGISFIVLAFPWIAFTIFANPLYHAKVKKKIAVTQSSIKDKSMLLEFLRHKGGVHTWVIWVCCLLPIIGILTAIVISQFTAYQRNQLKTAVEAPSALSPAPAATTKPDDTFDENKLGSAPAEKESGILSRLGIGGKVQESEGFDVNKLGSSPTRPEKEKGWVNTSRDNSFIAYDNGTVLDTKTNLMWAAKDNGSDINWQDAKSYCENYRGGGYSDWRMPTLDELAGLYDSNKSYKATQRNYNVQVTELIQLSSCCPWASETRGSEAATFYFHIGYRGWIPQSVGGTRALPVRSGK